MKQLNLVVILSLLLIIGLDQCQATAKANTRKELMECKERAFAYYNCEEDNCEYWIEKDHMFLICAESNNATVKIRLSKTLNIEKDLVIEENYHVHNGECEGFRVSFNNSLDQYTIETTLNHRSVNEIIPEIPIRYKYFNICLPTLSIVK